VTRLPLDLAVACLWEQVWNDQCVWDGASRMPGLACLRVAAGRDVIVRDEVRHLIMKDNEASAGSKLLSVGHGHDKQRLH
jgi:hypothetical protein